MNAGELAAELLRHPSHEVQVETRAGVCPLKGTVDLDTFSEAEGEVFVLTADEDAAE